MTASKHALSGSRAGLQMIARASKAFAAGPGRVAPRMPLNFGRTYLLVSAALLVAFCWQSLARPMPLVFTGDSFGYIDPGLEMAAGQDATGQSVRDLGYPVLTLLATRLGSLGTIPRLQLFIVAAGLACFLWVLFLSVEAVACRLHGLAGIPRPVLALCSAAAAAAYLVLLSSHDLFVINIYSLMAEAPHVLPTALALVLFVAGWTAPLPGRRVSFLATGTAVAYLSMMVKPHTAMVLALCAGSLLVVSARNVRAFRSPLVVAVCLASAGLVAAVHRLDVWITPPGNDFGPKTLFCNHLDVIEPVFDTSTPERARIFVLLRGILQDPRRWTLMGYYGDLCVFDQPLTEAIAAAAKSEGLSPASWEQRAFLKAVLTNPFAYGRDIVKQMSFFMVHTIDAVRISVTSHISDSDWSRLEPFASLIRIPRPQFEFEATNWVPSAYPAVAAAAKSALQTISDSFAAVTLGSTVLALAVVAFLRNRADLQLEITLLATGAFTTAFAMTTALAHTFDITRYLTDILPVSLLWWMLGAAYLAHSLVLAGALAFRRDRWPSRSAQVRATERL